MTNTEYIKQIVWQKGYIVPGLDSSRFRMDACGALIARDKYGDRSAESNNGWEIDHITPKAVGGSDAVTNLRPLQWYNNATKSYGGLTCPIKAAK